MEVIIKLHPWSWPEKPWKRVHTDFLGPYKGHNFLLIVDARTKWPEIFVMKSTMAQQTIKVFQQIFARHGLPRQIVSDNGPQFTSDEFTRFVSSAGIKHIRSAVKHPASNGAAENLVRSFKRKLKIMLKNGKTAQEAVDAFLFEYRSTQHCTTGETPAKLMLGRQIRTKFDLMRPDVKKHQEQAVHRQERNARGGRTTQFSRGERVWAKNFSRNEPPWTEATTEQRLGPVTYTVKLDSGGVVKRHVDQLVRGGALMTSSKPEAANGQDARQPARRSPRLNRQQA
nr:uncharacterized protein K02A2.6-like [Neodiprion pinetum]